MRKAWRGTVLAAVAAMGVAGAANDAEARIECEGAYQVIRGHGLIATPYCEDEYLAHVARGYGIRVTGAAIRHSPSRKEAVCQAIGHDGRVYSTCLKYRDYGCGKYDC